MCSGNFYEFLTISIQFLLETSINLDSPPSELVAFYGLGRHHNLRLLRSLKASDLSKGALHPELQREMTVADSSRGWAGTVLDICSRLKN